MWLPSIGRAGTSPAPTDRNLPSFRICNPKVILVRILNPNSKA
nr:MAG TPA: hypothetical protein [Caudoviricetes sp.]